MNKIKWISVKDRKPPMRQRVLVVIKNGDWRGISVAEFTDMGWSDPGDDYYFAGVTHWAEIPELPEE